MKNKKSTIYAASKWMSGIYRASLFWRRDSAWKLSADSAPNPALSSLFHGQDRSSFLTYVSSVRNKCLTYASSSQNNSSNVLSSALQIARQSRIVGL